MEAQTGRGVHVQVGMVHAVQPPQHGHRMEQHVLHVDGKVEHQEGHAAAAQAGSGCQWSSPTPWSAANTAAVYATPPTVTRTSTVFRSVSPRLAPSAPGAGVDRGRRCGALPEEHDREIPQEGANAYHRFHMPSLLYDRESSPVPWYLLLRLC